MIKQIEPINKTIVQFYIIVMCRFRVEWTLMIHNKRKFATEYIKVNWLGYFLVFKGIGIIRVKKVLSSNSCDVKNLFSAGNFSSLIKIPNFPIVLLKRLIVSESHLILLKIRTPYSPIFLQKINMHITS